MRSKWIYPAIVFVAVSTLAGLARAQTVTGTPGGNGTPGSTTAPAGAGGNGGDAYSTSGSGSDSHAIAVGGDGGAGGAGAPAAPAISSNGGSGGDGGYADAYADTNASGGPASAIAEAFGGLGGAGGKGGTGASDGTSGKNGQAFAQASSIATGNATSTAIANAIGGDALARAFAASDSGEAHATANVVSDSLTFLNNAVDGSTTGALFLTQSLTARFDAQHSGSGDAIVSLTGNRTGGMSSLNLTLNGTGASGTSAIPSQGNGGVTDFDLSAPCPIVANQTSTGGNGYGSDAYNVFWGGTGMVEANLSSTGRTAATSSVSLSAHAIGGNGAAGSTQGGDGGWGGDASADLSTFSPAGDVTLHVTFQPGAGGDAYGANHFAGGPGMADTSALSAISNSGAVDFSATLQAGNGGNGFDGANAGYGGDAILQNVGHASSATGNLTITQSAIAGNGGSVHSDGTLGMAGGGGNARSELYRSETDNNPLVTLHASAAGGNGGDISGAATTYFNAGAAGSATVNIADSTNRSITAIGQSVGGNAGADHGAQLLPGGQAWTMVNATSNGSVAGDVVSSSATATGGAGNGSPDSTYYNNAARAIALSAANGHANSIASAIAIGGDSTLGCGGWAYATGSATLNGDGTLLSATAIAVGGKGGGPYYVSYAGGCAIATAQINSAIGTAIAESTGGNSISSALHGGFADAEVDVADLRIIEQANPTDSIGGHAKVSYSNGQFTSLRASYPSLTVYGAGNVSTSSVNGVSTLTIGYGATLKIAAGGGNNNINILALPQGGKLDLTNNSLTLDDGPATTHLVDTRSELLAGDIFSTATDHAHTLGYGANTALTIKLTYLGDVNLDGKVDINDLGILAQHWQQSGYWTDGDFDYSGKIDINDLGLLAQNWQAGVTHPLNLSFNQALAIVGVPEPAAVLLAAGLLGAGRRRKRR